MFRVLEKKEDKDLSGNITTLYVFEDIFVQDRETRVAATDGKSILNGAYFKFANSSASEMGEPVVVINLDEQASLEERVKRLEKTQQRFHRHGL